MKSPGPGMKQGLARSILWGVGIGIGAALIFSAGFFMRDILGSSLLDTASAAEPNNYALLLEVQSLLDQHFLREQANPLERQYAAITGMLGTLNDRYTFFIRPTVARNESDALAGTYGGIGVQVTRNEKGEPVLYPFQDSPALRAGITDGDILLAVDNSPIDNSVNQDEINRMLRGEVREGNGVHITLRRSATTEEETLFVPFEVINVPSVIWRLMTEEAGLGYVQILSFTSRTPEELKIALDDLHDQRIEGLILDLRNNSGGLLQESIEVADEFLDGEVIVYERSNRQERTFASTVGGRAVDLPLVVLVNAGTASASELVAGAIQDNGRGLVVGQQTFGKGTVQQIFTLSDQSAVHITSAEWLTPDRHQLEENGLQPDVSTIPDPTGRDVELGEAVRQMKRVLQERNASDG